MIPCKSFISLNVRRLRDKNKRREMFRWLKHFHKGHDNIIFLQETHSTELDEFTWEQERGSKIIMSQDTGNRKGVAVLFPHNY